MDKSIFFFIIFILSLILLVSSIAYLVYLTIAYRSPKSPFRNIPLYWEYPIVILILLSQVIINIVNCINTEDKVSETVQKFLLYESYNILFTKNVSTFFFFIKSLGAYFCINYHYNYIYNNPMNEQEKERYSIKDENEKKQNKEINLEDSRLTIQKFEYNYDKRKYFINQYYFLFLSILIIISLVPCIMSKISDKENQSLEEEKFFFFAIISQFSILFLLPIDIFLHFILDKVRDYYKLRLEIIIYLLISLIETEFLWFFLINEKNDISIIRIYCIILSLCNLLKLYVLILIFKLRLNELKDCSFDKIASDVEKFLSGYEIAYQCFREYIQQNDKEKIKYLNFYMQYRNFKSLLSNSTENFGNREHNNFVETEKFIKARTLANYMYNVYYKNDVEISNSESKTSSMTIHFPIDELESVNEFAKNNFNYDNGLENVFDGSVMWILNMHLNSLFDNFKGNIEERQKLQNQLFFGEFFKN